MTGVCGVFILVDVVVFSDCDCDGVTWYCKKNVFLLCLNFSSYMHIFSIAIIIMYAIMFVL